MIEEVLRDSNLVAKQNDRQYWIDFAKGIAIFMVVLGHSGQSYLYISLYYIHLPVFIMISGFLLGNRRTWQKKSLWENICKKASDIIFPYVVFGLLYVVFNCVKLCIDRKSILNIYLHIRSVLLLENTSNWFLPPLFFSEVLLIWILQRYKSNRMHLLTMLLMIALVELSRRGIAVFEPVYGSLTNHLAYYVLMWAGRCGAFTYYLLVGYLLNILFTYFNEKTVPKIMAYICLTIFFSVILIVNQFPMVDLHFLYWENTIVYFFACTVGASSFITALFLLKPRCKIIEQLGKRSLIINGFHLAFELIPFSYIIIESLLPESICVLIPETIMTTIVTIVVCALIMIIIIPIIDHKLPLLLNYSLLNQLIIAKTEKIHIKEEGFR